MIRPTEYQLGNLVETNKGFTDAIVALGPYSSVELKIKGKFDCNDLMPVPISYNALYRCGWNIDKDTLISQGNLYFNVIKDGTVVQLLQSQYGSQIGVDILYFHVLQNLYLNLTGSKLKID